MDRNQTVRIPSSSVTVHGISLKEDSLPSAELLLGGMVSSENYRLKPFGEMYPLVDLVSELRWEDIIAIRSATCGPLSCIIIEGPKVADTQVLLIIPLMPIHKSDRKASIGASRLKEELSTRVLAGNIKCMDGDLKWFFSQP